MRKHPVFWLVAATLVAFGSFFSLGFMEGRKLDIKSGVWVKVKKSAAGDYYVAAIRNGNETFMTNLNIQPWPAVARPAAEPRFYHTQYEGLHYDIAVYENGLLLDVAGQGELMELQWMGKTLVHRHRTVPLLFYPIAELRLELPASSGTNMTVTNISIPAVPYVRVR